MGAKPTFFSEGGPPIERRQAASPQATKRRATEPKVLCGSQASGGWQEQAPPARSSHRNPVPLVAELQQRRGRLLLMLGRESNACTPGCYTSDLLCMPITITYGDCYMQLRYAVQPVVRSPSLPKRRARVTQAGILPYPPPARKLS